MEICIFEDLYFDRIEPLTFSRPTYDLVCGISSLKDKIVRHYSNVKISLHTRPYLESFLISKYPDLSINKIEEDDCL
ncbi:MAG: putative sugar nucleotidyl transferase, partial [Ignavibacteria bacterium]|nr:putative sugar nucleotidyl transferase [Ignavibacteria bacterium]